ncbi:hypothetical protein H8356DRAFT_1636878 [Neocallimastix lanati (nom. inval.)]|nr:hypothetical protein H8356DRAFT_1636878 [Neocallimastix sp. JGI-2020a]
MTENRYNKQINLFNVPKTNLYSNHDNIKIHLENNPHKSYKYHKHQRLNNHMHYGSCKNSQNQISYHSNNISSEHNSSSLSNKNSVISFQHKRIKPMERRFSVHFKRDLSCLINIIEHKNNSDISSLPKINEDKIKMILEKCRVLANIESLN